MPIMGRRCECRTALVPALRRVHSVHSGALLTCGDVRINDGLSKETSRSARLLLVSTQWMGTVHRVPMIVGSAGRGAGGAGLGGRSPGGGGGGGVAGLL